MSCRVALGRQGGIIRSRVWLLRRTARHYKAIRTAFLARPCIWQTSAPDRFCCGSCRAVERDGRCFGEDTRPLVLTAWPRGPAALTPRHYDAYAMHTVAAGGGRATNLVSRRKFWAMAARVNSSWAPRGPRNRRRPSVRIRLRWANSISTRFRACRDRSKASVPASERATSRASS